MKIEERFTIAAPAGAVWEFLSDPERVAGALPGAVIGRKIDDRVYEGGMSVRVGPLNASYNGTVTFDLDEENRSAVVQARGHGKAGMGNADMKMTSAVVALAPDRTEVTVDADLAVSGILAQLGRGMIQHVSKKMFRDFTQVLTKELSS